MNRPLVPSLDALISLTRAVREQVAATLSPSCPAVLADWRADIAAQLGCGADDDAWFADSLAQTIVCGDWSARLAAQSGADRCSSDSDGAASPDESRLLDYLRHRLLLLLPDVETAGLAEAVRLVRQADLVVRPAPADGLSQDDPGIHGYEHFIAAYDPSLRTRNGVFYTPSSVVRLLVQSIDDVLRGEFGLSWGLADPSTWSEMQRRAPGLGQVHARWADSPFVRILDPACGTGAFLVELLKHVQQTLVRQWTAEGLPPAEIGRRWVSHVVNHLLGSLVGFEAMMAPWAIAHIQLAATLARLGCWLRPEQQLRVYLTDTLADPAADPLFQPIAADSPGAATGRLGWVKDREPITVVIGNPPYAGISDNHDPWICKLMRGRGEGVPGRRSFYHVQGKPLGERKLWLTDDYVKFLRYAQWRIDRAGCGAVGFVTNHGYLDNPTFRGVRDSLLQSFSGIAVVDLHGNVKKREAGGDRAGDASVFATEQGMAVSLFWHPPSVVHPAGPRRILRGDLWGPRESKQQTLESATVRQLAQECVEPSPPDFLFVSRDYSHRAEYERGYRLPDVMPVGTTAVVTARDRLVIALTDEELLGRIGLLRDPTTDQDRIRAEFFGKSRSPKYAAGDTRGWKLVDARDRLQRDERWRDRVRSCLYRPFDRRSIYWADGMVDWPRSDVMRQLADRGNLALVARRQMLPDRECNYFWVTDRITIDGIIRSDNRGSESVFPLFLYGDDDRSPPARVNFSEVFQHAARRVLPDRPLTGSSPSGGPPAPVRWLGYLYAQFFSPTYRQRYADLLRADFPRLFLTSDATLWDSLADLGCRLMALHLGPGGGPESLGGQFRVDPPPDDLKLLGPGPAEVAPAFPKFSDGAVWISHGLGFHQVPDEIWEYRVGGHQVCRKWLVDRRGRRLSEAEVAQYRFLVWAVHRTIQLSAEIDRTIERAGGWPAAFEVS